MFRFLHKNATSLEEEAALWSRSARRFQDNLIVNPQTDEVTPEHEPLPLPDPLTSFQTPYLCRSIIIIIILIGSIIPMMHHQGGRGEERARAAGCEARSIDGQAWNPSALGGSGGSCGGRALTSLPSYAMTPSRGSVRKIRLALKRLTTAEQPRAAKTHQRGVGEADFSAFNDLRVCGGLPVSALTLITFVWKRLSLMDDQPLGTAKPPR